MTESSKGQLAILCTAVRWSTSGLFIKLVDWHPMVISEGRSFLAFFLLLALRPLNAPRPAPSAPSNATTHKSRANRVGIIGAGIGYCLTMILFVMANKMTTSANAIMLQYTCPVWTGLLGGLILKEKVRKETWGALVVILAGLVIFLKDGLGTGNIRGDVIALGSGLTFGAQAVFARMQKNGNPSDGMILAHFLTILVCLPFVVLHPPRLTPSSLAAMVYMGFFQIGLASFLFSYGIKRVTAIQAMLISTVEPLLNPVWVLCLTGERPTVSALIGGAMIISAVTASSLVTRLQRPVRYRLGTTKT
jgi:drug/metabolite transporter (DMT)-like permease